MRYHDYHLTKYEVSDRGETITFNLVYDYPGQKTDDSCIRFSNVTLYNFVHTTNAIITDIEEVAVSDLLKNIRGDVVEWHRMYCVKMFKNNLQDYIQTLQVEGYKAWHIESAVGFYGFIIAKSVENY